MKNNEIDTKVTELEDKIVNLALVAFSLIISVTFIIVTLRAVKFGFVATYFIQAFDWLILFLLVFYRKRLFLDFKLFVFLGVMLVMVITGIYSYGYLASAKIFIVIIPVFASFVMSFRKAIGVLMIYISVYILFAYLYSIQLLDYDIHIDLYARNYISWSIDAGTIFFTSIGLLYVSYYFKKHISINNTKIYLQNIELINQEKKYRTLFESSNDAIVLIENDYFFDCNSITYKMFKCQIGFFEGKAIYEFSPEFQPDGSNSYERSLDILKNVSLGGSYVYDWQLLRPNGELFDVSISITLVELDNNNYFLLVLRDITDKKHTEIELEQHRKNLELLVKERTKELNASNHELKIINDELSEKNKIIIDKNKELQKALKYLKETQIKLLQADKMASLGILTSGVAHEINNPLNFIKGGLDGLESYFIKQPNEKSELIDVLLSSIGTGIYRVETIVNSLNQFSRNNNTLNESYNIHVIIDNCLVMLQNKIKHRIKIEKKYFSETCLLRGNVGKLHQLFINILMNAIQAIEGEGLIGIETKLLDSKVTITITDTGCGISEVDLTKVMDPFYTTKDPGQGTGLGLSISYTIIQEHKGEIEFQSEKNKGTTVIVSLPINNLHSY
jgi:PAS domain S-box-containing protein